MKAGINEIGIVINPQQRGIIDYLSVFNEKLKIQYLYQTEQLGIAHALTKAQSFVGNDSFILMLGDNLIAEPIETLKQAYIGNKGALLLSQIENASDYGIAEIKNNRVVNVEEKPEFPKSKVKSDIMCKFGFG
nr:sugar phosphate nucleotidyltransferase [Paenactinomyces guangxiensis]